MALRIQAQIKINTKKLKAMPKLVDKAIIKGLQKGAFEVERKAKSYAPIDTGTLMRSIKTKPVKRTTDGYSISVAPNVEYAEFMERPGRVRRRGRRPFMQPALKNSIRKIVGHLTNEIRKVIR